MKYITLSFSKAAIEGLNRLVKIEEACYGELLNDPTKFLAKVLDSLDKGVEIITFGKDK